MADLLAAIDDAWDRMIFSPWFVGAFVVGGLALTFLSAVLER